MDQIEFGIDIMALSFIMSAFPKETTNPDVLRLINKMGSLVTTEQPSAEMMLQHLITKYLPKE